MKHIFINGCFDILHVGHIRLFEFAADLGDFLSVGINSDASVKKLKGAAHPINNENDRYEVLKSIRYINTIDIFMGGDCADLIKNLKPDIIVKGGDYCLETLNKLELSAAQEVGARFVFFPHQKGYSSTKLISEST